MNHFRIGSHLANSIANKNSLISEKPSTSVNKHRISMLSSPKYEYEPNNIFKHSDFRGLLHADYEEAI